MDHTRTPTRAQTGQRGVTMVSVMLLAMSLLTVGLLVVRGSVREVTEAGQLIARERALMVAQAAVDLAAARFQAIVATDSSWASNQLKGYFPQADAKLCTDPCKDCIPGENPQIPIGQRNAMLASGTPVDCNGRPCMRQGAIVNVSPSDAIAQNVAWCNIPINSLLTNADPEARVSVWVRNNASEALGSTGTSDWETDSDKRLVFTAMAMVRDTTVTVEQEVMLGVGGSPAPPGWQTPDEGYGGGHNNDNSAVSLCTDTYVQGKSK